MGKYSYQAIDSSSLSRAPGREPGTDATNNVAVPASYASRQLCQQTEGTIRFPHRDAPEAAACWGRPDSSREPPAQEVASKPAAMGPRVLT